MRIEEYPIETYKKIAERKGFEKLEHFERYLLLKRFGREVPDIIIYEIANDLTKRSQTLENLIKKYESRFKDYSARGLSFYISYDDRDKFIKEIAKAISDKRLAKIFRDYRPQLDITGLDIFRGGFYTYKLGGELKIGKSEWYKVYDDTLEVIEKTKGRAYPFLKAIIDLYKIRDYSYLYGPHLTEIQTLIRSMEGRPIMLAPNDYILLKVYKVYYKSGSKRYPGHSIPFEIIPPCEKALEYWKTKRGFKRYG